MVKKKSESILVPLLPRYDASSIYNRRPFRESIGRMTVTRDDAFPRTVKFENNVSFRDEALIESKVFETLSVFLGNTSPGGYVVSVEYYQGHLMPNTERERVKETKCLPRGFDAEMLEFPILVCALKTYGLARDMPEEVISYGSLSRKTTSGGSYRFVNRNGRVINLDKRNIKLLPDYKVTAVLHDNRTIVNHLARLQRLAVFSPDFAEELLGPADRNTVTVQERVDHVLDAGSSPDFIRKLKDVGFISEGVPVRYRDAILKKAREVFDADLELWDQRVAPMFEEQFSLTMPWVIGDFYGNPRKAELKRKSYPTPVRVLPEANWE